MDSNKNYEFLTPMIGKPDMAKYEHINKAFLSPEIPWFGGFKKQVLINSPEEEKGAFDEHSSPSAVSPQSQIPYANKLERLKSKMENCESHCQYFVSYQVSNLDSFIDIYIKHGASILQWLDYEMNESIDFSKRMTKNKSSKTDSSLSKEEYSLDDIKMEWCDRIPHIDRPSFPISQVIDLIPRLLFNKQEIRVETSRAIKDEFWSTSVYLSSVGEYMYITGLLLHSNLFVKQNFINKAKRWWLIKRD